MRTQWAILGMAGLLLGGACRAGEWVTIPEHATRTGPAGGFEMGRCEVTVAEFVEYLHATRADDFPRTAQIERRANGRPAIRRGAGRQAVSEVTADEAAAYCRWVSEQTGRPVRLPTEAEWEVAARGGVDGAPYPWGWGGQVSKMARFDAGGPAVQGGRFPANGFGLQDMAGNLYEWCGRGPGHSRERRVARGGSWAERDRALLDVARRQWFRADYRGRDVGFRVLREKTGARDE